MPTHTPLPVPATGAAHRQGGDLRHLPGARNVLDLSTCVNRYGPPPTVREALASVDARALLPHPYAASDEFTAAYAEHMGVDPAHLLAGRGITEFLTLLARVCPAEESTVVTPDYTDTIRLFPRHTGPAEGVRDTAQARAERVERAMRRNRFTVLSNPNNPLGISVPRDELVRICAANPGSVLIVDEAYIDFTTGAEGSMTASGLDNVVVLQSPNKPFGIAGVRTGGMWTRNAELRERVRRSLLNWPISYLDAAAATAALSARAWASATLSSLVENGRRLEKLLTERFGDAVVPGAEAHYRFVHLEDPRPVYRRLVEAGVAVRIFSGSDPGRVSGMRIVAPTTPEMPRVEAALARVPALP
ncbi:histidinol-phosphate aminotransferase family protein [Nocardiopsis sp. CNT-189]|uniref:aminotransferase class I/II-fold pyridoxal phosphate-dependent enzyme n=1 Tax=Nocardiopsis oceanisediminis TaxID=2816862 RepID=UPI003B2A4F4C